MKKQKAVRTKCNLGHELSTGNFRIDKNGYRVCKKCAVIHSTKFREKLSKNTDSVEYKQFRKYHREYSKRKSLEVVSVLAHRKSVKKWESKNKEKAYAHSQVSYAIKSGKMKSMPCIACGAEKTDAHHPDYSKPLEVLWLCRQHHKDIHGGRLTLSTL